jgi:hypothetical protein
MKRMEVVMNHLPLEAFTQSAADLGIGEFNLSAVRQYSRRSLERQQLYRGNALARDLVQRTKVEFVVFDEDVKWMPMRESARCILRVSFKVDETISLNFGISEAEDTRLIRNTGESSNFIRPNSLINNKKCLFAGESADRLGLLWKVKDRMPSISIHSNRSKCVLSGNPPFTAQG